MVYFQTRPKRILRRKAGAHPHQIIFEQENAVNTCITWEDKMKPRIDLDDGITQEEYRALASRWDEMLSLAEEIIWRNYLNPKSDDLMSEVDSFPDIRFSPGITMWGTCPTVISIGTKSTRHIILRRAGCGISTTTAGMGIGMAPPGQPGDHPILPDHLPSPPHR